MTDKIFPSPLGTNNSVLPNATGFKMRVLPWVVCGLAAAFYCYEYLLRITPGLIVPELQRAFSVHGAYLDATQIGHLSAFYYYAYTPMQIPVGLLMDRYGPRCVITFAVFCCAAGTVLFGFTEALWLAAVGRFFTGFGSAFAFVGVLKLASTWLPANRFGMVTGLATSLGMIGAMLGAVFLTKLIDIIGWREMLFYASSIGFIMMPIIWLVVRDAPPNYRHASDLLRRKSSGMSFRQLWQEIRSSIKNPQIWLSGVIGGLLMAPTMVFPELWGKPYLEAVHHFTPLEASTAVTFVFLGWAVGGPLAGLFSDLLGRRRLPLIIGSILATALLLFFLYYPTLSKTEIQILLFGIGFVSSVQVICFAISRENCSAGLAGTVVAVTNFSINCFSISQVVVAKILDLTWDGKMLDNAKVYSIESYQTSMMLLPIATLLALMLIFFLRETYCKPLVTAGSSGL